MFISLILQERKKQDCAVDEMYQTKTEKVSGDNDVYKKYIFKTKLEWSGFKRGTLTSPGKLNIYIATPPEANLFNIL